MLRLTKKLSFGEHVKNICKRANNKLAALARATPYIAIRKRKLLLNAFISAPFNYCPLIWILHCRCNNNVIIRSNTFTEDVSHSSTMTKALHMNNFHEKIDQFLSTIKVLKSFLSRSLKSKTL